MKFDKLSLFADNLSVPTSANTTTYSKVIDLRKCGQIGIDGMLRIWGGVIGTANATGSVTTKLQTFDADGSGVTDVVSTTQNGGDLMGIIIPCKGLKRFVRLAFAVGATALGSAIKVKAGIVDQFNLEDLPSIQAYPPVEDLMILGDRVNTDLDVAENSKTIAAGANADVSISAGVVAAVTAPSGYTVTVSLDKVNIAVASTASTGNVVLAGTTGASETIAVTVGS